MPITPDTKDWTWVLERPCPECGFDSATVDRGSVAQMVRANAAGWRSVMDGDADRLRTRPSDDRWSALEYACHSRDVFRLYLYRLGLMLDQEDPSFPNWDQDETALTDRYGDQDPATVTDELVDAAEQLAAAFEQVTGCQWSRTGRRSDGANFTVESFALYMVHDPIHHLHDATTDLA